jgi:short-subunit dehydrogenase
MKHIVITGGSDGIGRALARNLASDFQVTLLARNAEKLEELATELSCDFVICDVRKSSDVAAAFAKVKSRHGSIDILVNNAGVIVNGDLTETAYDTIEAVMSTNAMGAIFVTKACLEIMKPQKSGLYHQRYIHSRYHREGQPVYL